MNASIIFFPWTAKKSSKTGKTPLYMRVNFNRTKAETRLNAELTENDLLLWDEFTMRFKDRKHPLNGYLNAIVVIVMAVIAMIIARVYYDSPKVAVPKWKSNN